MSDHNFYLHDSVHILRSNGTTEHADAVVWAVERIAALEAALEPFAYARNHSGSEIAVADFDRARAALVKIEEKSE